MVNFDHLPNITRPGASAETQWRRTGSPGERCTTSDGPAIPPNITIEDTSDEEKTKGDAETRTSVTVIPVSADSSSAAHPLEPRTLSKLHHIQGGRNYALTP